MSLTLENDKIKIQINYIEVYNRLVLGYPIVFHDYAKITNWIKSNSIDSLNTIYFNIIRKDQTIYAGKLNISNISNFCFKNYLSANLERMLVEKKISEEHFDIALVALNL